MPAVNITIADDGATASVTVNPPTVRIGGGASLTVTWILNANKTGWTWSTEVAGIVLSTTPPMPYLPWNGDPVTPNPGGVYSVTGFPNLGPTAQRFKYTINLSRGGDNPGKMSIDPDIANDPQGMGDTHGRGDTHKR